MKTTAKAPPESYRNAMVELQEIVDRLTAATDIDVDELVADVARAKTLIEFCQEKIGSAESKIREMVKDIKDDGDAASEPESDPAPAAKKKTRRPAASTDADANGDSEIPF